MNGNLGRDKVWGPDIWANIDKAVAAEVGPVRVAQKVFPTTPMPNAQSVPADIFDPNAMAIQEGQTKALVEVFVVFPLTQSQVDNEATQHTGQKLARLAAKTVGLAEDIILFQGQNAVLPAGVGTANLASVQNGLVRDAANAIQVDRAAENYPESIFQAVVDGIARLTAQGQPGPYGLFLENAVYADAYTPEEESLVTPADRIKPLVTGGFYPTGALLVPAAGAGGNPQRFGLLASLGGEPVSIYVGVDTVTAFNQVDQVGVLRFRVFERVQYVARDTRALVRLEFVN
jgi:uncharacterized linocin/CFP29 family protein